MLLDTVAAVVQDSALSSTLRGSQWLYPLVNTGHLVGIALLFGAIAPLDLRLLGCWKSVPLDALARILVPVAVAGIVLAASTGALLFATKPRDYVHEPLFGLKLTLIAAAVLNALVLRRSPSWGFLTVAEAGPRPAWRTAGLLSLALWLGAITAGRLIGYR